MTVLTIDTDKLESTYMDLLKDQLYAYQIRARLAEANNLVAIGIERCYAPSGGRS